MTSALLAAGGEAILRNKLETTTMPIAAILIPKAPPAWTVTGRPYPLHNRDKLRRFLSSQASCDHQRQQRLLAGKVERRRQSRIDDYWRHEPGFKAR